jgi:hypothetical protein
MKKEKKLERARKDGFSEEVRVGWFKKLHEILITHDILHKPQQMFNTDESGFSDETKCESSSNIYFFIL